MNRALTFFMADSPALPPEVLAFLVRTLPLRDVWNWLGEDSKIPLRHRVTRGFRATPEVLRQPAARTRLVSHLQNSEGDCSALLKIWETTNPKILDEIRALDDADLISHLPQLQDKHGAESLLLALLHEEKEAAIEAWTSAAESDASTSDFDESDEIEEDEESPLSLYREEIEKLKKQLAHEIKKTAQSHEKYKELQTRAAQTEKLLRGQLLEHEKLAREANRNFKAEANRVAVLEVRLEEAEKARERAERRAKSTLAESESAIANLKTARRQLHRLQQINEELRGQLAARREQDKETKRQEDKAKTPASGSVSDEAKATPLAVHPPCFDSSLQPARGVHNIAKIKTALDHNEENFVATLRAELSTLRARDDAAYKALRKRVRELGKWYERVLTTQTARVLVDASNIARYDAAAKGRLEYLLAMRDELRRGDFFPIVFIADASLPHFIDEPKKLREMIARGEVLITASGQQADEVLARQARETGAYVVTNDRNFHFAFAPDFTPARIGFTIEDGVVLLNEF